MYIILSTPTTWASMGWATVAATTAPEAPGYTAVTDTCGGTISGYCAIGIDTSASAPAIVVTIAMTIASRGRSTKTDDNICQPRSATGGEGVARTAIPGRTLCRPSTITNSPPVRPDSTTTPVPLAPAVLIRLMAAFPSSTTNT